MHENITKLIDRERIPMMIPVVLLQVMAEKIGGTFFIQDAQHENGTMDVMKQFLQIYRATMTIDGFARVKKVLQNVLNKCLNIATKECRMIYVQEAEIDVPMRDRKRFSSVLTRVIIYIN